MIQRTKAGLLFTAVCLDITLFKCFKKRGGGGGGRLFEGGDYFKYFGQRGAIIRGRRLIEGRLLFKEIR